MQSRAIWPIGSISMDIREKPYLHEEDLLALNFIRSPALYIYRRHYRHGLRSHIMEVLHPRDVQYESKGIVLRGVRSYPRATPRKVLRIFRIKFKTLEAAIDEVSRVRTVAAYLAPDHMAKSEEFLVTYVNQGKPTILLCGLQEYVQGEILDPWSPLDESHLISLRQDMGCQGSEPSALDADEWLLGIRKKAGIFVGRVKTMIRQAHHVPDLAGVGNLILTRYGGIKLVDINNVSRVYFDSHVRGDDRGYPVCDKSIEALSLLERKLLQRAPSRRDPIYQTFLDRARMEEVKAKEETFQLATETSPVDPGTS